MSPVINVHCLLTSIFWPFCKGCVHLLCTLWFFRGTEYLILVVWIFVFLHVMFCCIYGCCTPEYSKQCLYPDINKLCSLLNMFLWLHLATKAVKIWWFYWVNDMNTKTQFYIFLEWSRFMKYRSIVPVEGNRILVCVRCSHHLRRDDCYDLSFCGFPNFSVSIKCLKLRQAIKVTVLLNMDLHMQQF